MRRRRRSSAAAALLGILVILAALVVGVVSVAGVDATGADVGAEVAAQVDKDAEDDVVITGREPAPSCVTVTAIESFSPDSIPISLRPPPVPPPES